MPVHPRRVLIAVETQEYSNAEAKPFALLYQFTGDQNNSLRVLYNCSAARVSEESSTINNWLPLWRPSQPQRNCATAWPPCKPTRRLWA